VGILVDTIRKNLIVFNFTLRALGDDPHTRAHVGQHAAEEDPPAL